MPVSISRKLFQRGGTVILHFLLQLLAPLTNIGVSIWVIRSGDEAVWGEFVDPLLFIGITLHILAWGNKEYLLRGFAQHPDQIGPLFRQVAGSRAVLLFMVFPVILLAEWDWETTMFLVLWMLGGFLRQSLDVLVVYHRHFERALLVDLLGSAVLVAGLWFDPVGLSITGLVKYFAFAAIVRGILLGALYGPHYFRGNYPPIQFRYFRLAMPFFLLGFAGMVSLRTDLLCVAFWMDDAAAGRYQVFINLFLWAQAGIGFLLYPFAKNIYRLPRKSFAKLARRMLGAGVLVSVAGIPAIWAVLKFLFDLEFDLLFFLLAPLYLLPCYLYSVYIYLLYQKGKQQQVLLANTGAILVNLALNILLIAPLGLLGAWIGSAGGQLFMLVMVLVYVQQLGGKGKN